MTTAARERLQTQYSVIRQEAADKHGGDWTLVFLDGKCNPVEVHHVPLMEGGASKVSDNSQNTSLYWFRHAHSFHKVKRLGMNWQMRYSFESQESLFGSMGVESLVSKVPVVEHADVWSFYDAIGYDRKKKRFTA